MKVHVQLVFELQIPEGDTEVVRSFTHDVRKSANEIAMANRNVGSIGLIRSSVSLPEYGAARTRKMRQEEAFFVSEMDRALSVLARNRGGMYGVCQSSLALIDGDGEDVQLPDYVRINEACKKGGVTYCPAEDPQFAEQKARVQALASLFDAAEALCDGAKQEGDSVEEKLQRIEGRAFDAALRGDSALLQINVVDARLDACELRLEKLEHRSEARPSPAVRRALETLTPNRGPYTVCPNTLEILGAKGQGVALPDYNFIRAAHSTVDGPDEVMRRQEDKVRALATILSAAEG